MRKRKTEQLSDRYQLIECADESHGDYLAFNGDAMPWFISPTYLIAAEIKTVMSGSKYGLIIFVLFQTNTFRKVMNQFPFLRAITLNSSIE